MFGNNKRNKIPITKKDINQVVKKLNDKLKTNNKTLDQNISLKKEKLTSLTTDISIITKESETIKENLTFLQKDFVVNKNKLSKEQVKLNKIEKTYKDLASQVDKADVKFKTLNKESDILIANNKDLNDNLSQVSTVKEELNILNNDKQDKQLKLNSIVHKTDVLQKKIPSIEGQIVQKELDCKNLLQDIKDEIKTKKYSLNEIDKEYLIKANNLKESLTNLENLYSEKNQEITVLESIVNKKENEYIAMDAKCIQAQNELMNIKDQSKTEIDKSKNQIQKQQNSAKQWRLNFFEEIAKIKLKKKIETIDIAGLKEAFNV